MAIQERRGNIADLDPSKLVQGEPFICLDKDSNNRYYAGIAIAPNEVMRLADFNDLTDVLIDCENARDTAVEAAENASTSETNAAESERNAENYWTYVHDAIELVTPEIEINFATGQLEVSGSSWYFSINQST